MRWQAREKGTSPSSSPSGATPPAAPADAGLPSEAPATELAEAVAALRALDHVPAAHAALFERVCAPQWRARQRLSGKAFYPALSAEAASQRLSNGFHLIDFARLRLDEAELRPLWEGLSAVLAEFGELSPAQAERGRKLAAAGKLSLTELAGIVLEGDGARLAALARRVRLPQRHLAWLATFMLRPHLAAAAESLAARLGGVSWPHPTCPACGHEPLMALLVRPDGRRLAECSMCATRWEARRGRCAFYGNEDKESYKFLYYDLDSPYRVDVCDKCRRYLKVADERKMAVGWATQLAAEDVATLYFDVLVATRDTRRPGGPCRASRLPRRQSQRGGDSD